MMRDQSKSVSGIRRRVAALSATKISTGESDIQHGMINPLAAFSSSVARLVAATAPSLAAIRTAPDRHVTGLLCPDGTIATTHRALPVLDHHTVVLPRGELVAAWLGLRDRAANLAILRLEKLLPVAPPAYGSATLGGLAIVLAADAAACPTARLR